jgi:hypothetical protein
MITGTAPAGRMVSAPLRAGGGEGAVRATAVEEAGPTGDWMLRLRAPREAPAPRGPVRVRAGDVLWVDTDGGDPRRVTIPPLEAVVDVDQSQVVGEAPPAASLELELRRPIGIDEGDERLAFAEVAAGVDGRWRVTSDGWWVLGGAATSVHFEPPRHGRLRWRGAGGFVFERNWAAIAITASARSSVLQGVGAPERRAAITVTDAAGRLVGNARGGPSGLEGTVAWGAGIDDPLGLPVAPASGDRIQVRIGDQEAEWRVPPLSAGLDTTGERVVGATRPSTTVTVRLLDAGAFTREGRSGTDGRFAIELADVVDLRHSDRVEISLHEKRFTWQSLLRSPALTLDLDSGMLYGWAEPDTGAVLRHTRAGTEGAVWALSGGDFAIQLGAGSIARPDPAWPGDVIELSMPRRDAGDRLVRWVVPTFELALDAAGGRVTGRVDPPILPTISARPAFFGSPAVARWGGGAVEASIAADGRLAGTFAGATGPLPAGLFVRGWLNLPEGHMLLRRTATPVLELQVDGPSVCGFGPPRSAVTIDVRDESGRPSGLLRTSTGPEGRFALLLPAADGTPLRLRGGSRVRAEVAGQSVAATVPTVTLNVDWRRGDVDGRVPPDGLWNLRWPSAGCLAAATDGAPQGGIAGIAIRPDATGAFRATIPVRPSEATGAGSGQGIALEQLSEAGHRLYRNRRPAALDLYVDRARVTVRGEAHAPLDLALLEDPRGQARAWLNATADGWGRGSGRWLDASGEPVAARAGNLVIGRAGGDEVEIDVEPLSFDYAPAAGIVGIASPGRELALRLVRPVDVALDTPGLLLTLQADAQGRFALREAPPRAGWTFAELLHIELSAPADPRTVAYHRLVAAWSRDTGPEIARGRAWLPWLGRRW